MIPSNLHTHTLYTDGKNTVAEMAEAAFAAGLTVLGFSEHSYTPQFPEFPGLAPEHFPDYCREVLEARERYAGRMEIFLGLEQDILSPPPTEGLDYTIGSVHSFLKAGEYVVVDDGAARLLDFAERLYDGDLYALCADYYRQEAEVLKVTAADIVGHFDLVTKYNEGGALFEEEDRRYRDAAFSALDALLERDPIFEINTGAIARGHRTTPYPSAPILRRIREKGGRITFSSDSHAVGTVTAAFSQAEELAKACGFRGWWTLKREGENAVFTERPL